MVLLARLQRKARHLDLSDPTRQQVATSSDPQQTQNVAEGSWFREAMSRQGRT